MLTEKDIVWGPFEVAQADDANGEKYMVLRRRGTLDHRFVDVDIDLGLAGLHMNSTGGDPEEFDALVEAECAAYVEALLKADQA